MNTEVKRLYRSRTNRMISGLCAGIGEYIGLDPTIVRVIAALSAFFLFPAPIIIYFILLLIVPEDPTTIIPPPQ